MPSPRAWASYGVLLLSKALSRLFYRTEARWVAEPPPDPWSGIRLVALLNHTSLYEWLFASVPPNSFLFEAADKAVIPAAAVTLERPIVGRFFHLLTRHVVPISREPDHTWQDVLTRIGPQSMVIILPEGRMKRADGLDKHGRPMTVRGGIADILAAIPEGRMLLAYSGGLHHVQVPGQLLPRPFKTLRIRLELVEIAPYREAMGHPPGSPEFKRGVKEDLERRRDRHC